MQVGELQKGLHLCEALPVKLSPSHPERHVRFEVQLLPRTGLDILKRAARRALVSAAAGRTADSSAIHIPGT